MSQRTVPGPLDEIRELIINRPQVQVSQAIITLIDWLLVIIHCLLITTLGDDSGNCFTDLEDFKESATEDLERIHKETTAVAKQMKAFTATPPSATTNTPTTSTTPSRCTKCHARGHDASNCKTKAPNLMRKRVARNNQIAKAARRERLAQVVQPIHQQIPIAPPVYPPSGPAYSYPSTPMNYAALVADSTELRRRMQQSTRDKRKRKSTSNTQSLHIQD